MEEIWKDVAGWEGLYQVSTYGRVKSLKYGKERILKHSKNSSGYLTVGLSIESKTFSKVVHRLVAIAFVPNPDNKCDVNHIDEDKTNNNVNNLNWMTRSENVNWGTSRKRAVNTFHMNRLYKDKIKVIYPSGEIEIFNSAADVSRAFGVPKGNISRVLSGKRKRVRGLRIERVTG